MSGIDSGSASFSRNLQYYKFCAYGFLKNLRFYEPFLMLFFLEKGLSFAQIGVLYAAREIFINVAEIPSGLLADTLGRRLTMIASFMAYIVSFLVFYGASEFWVLFGAMALYAFGDAFRTGTHKAMIFDYLNAHGWSHLRTHYYGHTRGWSKRGSAVSALIAAGLVFWNQSYAPVFLFTIIPYVLDMILIMSYPANLDGPRHGSTKTVRDEFAGVLRSLTVSMKNPDALRAISNQALYSGYYKACKDYLQPILQALALTLPVLVMLESKERTAIVTGVVYSLLYVATAFASSSSGRFSERFSGLARPLNLTLLVGIGFGFFAGMFQSVGIPVMAVLLYVGVYVLENLRKPMGISYVSERMNPESLASALSVESQAETLFAAGIALLLGLLSSRFGVGPGVIIVSALCAVLGILIRLPSEQQPSKIEFEA